MVTSPIADVSTPDGSNGEVEATGIVPALTIVSHPHARRAGERCLLDAVALGGELALSRNAPDFFPPGSALGSPLGDPFISRQPIRFAAGTAGAIRLTAAPGATPVTAELAIGDGAELTPDQLANGVVLELAGRVVVLLHLVERGDEVAGDALGMLGHSAGIHRVRVALERLDDLTVPVLIRGETGTGKELVARALHDRSSRRAGPFVSVNLGAIPRELAAAELFGAVRGAYTGATREREGLFRAAHGGSLFLDEIGEAPPEIQVMLLRVLETGELYPVGGDRPVASHARLIAATDAPLERQIDDGRFKAPLLHRLAGYEIQVPPLRARRDDIGVLVYHFARQELEAIGEAHRLQPSDPYDRPWLPAAIAARLVGHGWPGNVRELRNVIRQLVLGSRGNARLRLDAQLSGKLSAAARHAVVPAEATPSVSPGAVRRKPAEVTEHELVEALRAHAWDLQAAADQLQIRRSSMYDLLERYPHIQTAGSLGADEIERCFQAHGDDLDAMAAELQVSRRALQRRVKELRLVAAPSARPDRRRPR
jgi:two-component system, NtrC family, nitrogen regulation response regulator GlnG